MHGSSIAIVGAIIVVVVVAAGIGIYFLSMSGKTGSPPPSTGGTGGTGGGTQTTLSQAFQSHLSAISSRNYQAVSQQYLDNATVVWVGNTQGLGGTYQGSTYIQILWSRALGSASKFTVTNTSYNLVSFTPNKATVNASLTFNGNSSYLGAMNGNVVAVIAYVYSGSSWLIQNENWNFQTFNVQYSGGATTFPEWQRIGPPNTQHTGPDLTHNIAWEYGPLFAVVLYALIASVAVVAVVAKVWNRSK